MFSYPQILTVTYPTHLPLRLLYHSPNVSGIVKPVILYILYIYLYIFRLSEFSVRGERNRLYILTYPTASALTIAHAGA